MVSFSLCYVENTQPNYHRKYKHGVFCPLVRGKHAAQIRIAIFFHFIQYTFRLLFFIVLNEM